MEQKQEGESEPLAEGTLCLTHIVTDSSDTSVADELVKKLRLELERYRTLVRASAQVILTANPGGMVEEDVFEWRAYTGQTVEEMRGQGWANALHPDERESVMQGWLEAMASKQTYETQLRLRRADGIYRTFLAHVVPIFEGDGDIREWVGIATDITQYIQREEVLREQESRYRTMFESTPAGLAHVGLDGRILLVNQGFCDLLGYTREELYAHTFLDITYADDRNADQGYVERALAGDPQPYLREKRYIHKNGSLVWVNLITTLVRDATGAPLFFISVII